MFKVITALLITVLSTGAFANTTNNLKLNNRVTVRLDNTVVKGHDLYLVPSENSTLYIQSFNSGLTIEITTAVAARSGFNNAKDIFDNIFVKTLDNPNYADYDLLVHCFSYEGTMDIMSCKFDTYQARNSSIILKSK